VSPTTTPTTAATDQALQELVTSLQALDIPATTLERARETGALVLELTDDPALAAAALLHFATHGVDEPPALPAALRNRLAPRPCVWPTASAAWATRSDEQWSAGRPLKPGRPRRCARCRWRWSATRGWSWRDWLSRQCGPVMRASLARSAAAR
jgi:hypothetical protein